MLLFFRATLFVKSADDSYGQSVLVRQTATCCPIFKVHVLKILKEKKRIFTDGKLLLNKVAEIRTNVMTCSLISLVPTIHGVHE